MSASLPVVLYRSTMCLALLCCTRRIEITSLLTAWANVCLIYLCSVCPMSLWLVFCLWVWVFWGGAVSMELMEAQAALRLAMSILPNAGIPSMNYITLSIFFFFFFFYSPSPSSPSSPSLF